MGLLAKTAEKINYAKLEEARETPLILPGTPGATPIFRWAGSKKKLLPNLQLAAPAQYDRYIDPFFGSGILFLNLRPKNSIISDINPHLIQAYEVIREHPKRLWNTLVKLPSNHDFYYKIRSVDPSKLGKIERAARFIYLNRYCFNGVYRTNLQGGFNVSRGKGHLGIPSYEVFEAFSKKLQNTELHCADFEAVIKQARKGDFIYLDPPYLEADKRDRGEYGAGTFNNNDFHRFINAVKKASDNGAQILISYIDCPSLKSELKGWYIDSVQVTRSVSCNKKKRGKTKEIFLSNYIHGS